MHLVRSPKLFYDIKFRNFVVRILCDILISPMRLLAYVMVKEKNKFEIVGITQLCPIHSYNN